MDKVKCPNCSSAGYTMPTERGEVIATGDGTPVLATPHECLFCGCTFIHNDVIGEAADQSTAPKE